MSEFMADVRYALRALRKSPAFTTVAVLTLALGIGANSAIFSVVNGVVLKPLSYPQPERLVGVFSQFPTLGFDKFWISPPEYLELKERSRSYEAIGGYRTGQLSIGGGDAPERVTAATATWDFFDALGVAPLYGRTYTAAEDVFGAPPVVVLSHGLWRRAFAGDPNVVGRTIDMNGLPTEVIGVMPEGFDIADAGVEAWTPARINPATLNQQRGSHFLYLVGRLRPGVTLPRAETELESLLRRWEDEDAGHAPNTQGHRMFLRPLQDDLVGDIRPALLMLLGAVGFVLLIACANVGNLLLAKAEGRGKEIAVRSALGAGRARLLRQFLTESVVLSLAGGVTGLVLGWLGLRALLATSPDSIPRAEEIGLDGSVLLFTLAVSILTGLIFGLAPAFHLSPRTMNSALREGGQRATAGTTRQRLRRLLVVSEVALAVVLVVGSGLMLRSFAALQRVDPGFDARNLLTFRLFLPGAQGTRYEETPARVGFMERAIQRLGALPGVQSVAAMSGLPPRRDVNANDTEFEGYVPTEDGPAQNTDYWQFVTTDYFETMQIPLVSGRTFGPQDGPEATPVVIINETLARVFYPNTDPVGRRLRPPFGDNPWFTIVGVAKDVKQGGLEENTGTEVYFHYPQAAFLPLGVPFQMNFVLRTTPAPHTLMTGVRREMAALDASLPLAQMSTFDDVLHASVAQPRFLTLLLGIFAAIALALAAVGTYGVMSYSVVERRQEIGIRMALGAQAGGVLRMVLGQGVLVAGIGLALGIAGSFAMSRMLSSLLFGVSARDLVTFMFAPAVLAVVALLACYLPAWRATRVDPVRVLRQE
jgi:putative ABC transport system permease protein